MKNMLVVKTTALLLTAALQSQANEIFTCTASNHEHFSFQLLSQPPPFQSGYVQGLATDLHPLNVSIEGESVKILVKPIQTRTIVGAAYSFHLPSGASVNLQNITYVPEDFDQKLGVSGTAELTDGEKLNVVCK